jgi:hypothetical protein
VKVSDLAMFDGHVLLTLDGAEEQDLEWLHNAQDCCATCQASLEECK